MLNRVMAALPRGLVVAALCSAALAQAQTPAQAFSGRIGFVYTERLMTESKLAKAADAKLQAEFSKRQKQIDDTMARYKSSREKFDEEAPKLGDADRTKRTRELLDMEKDVQRMQREYNEDLFQRKNEERQAIAPESLQTDRTGGRAGTPGRRAAGIRLDQPAHRHHRPHTQAARQVSRRAPPDAGAGAGPVAYRVHTAPAVFNSSLRNDQDGHSTG